MRIPDYYIEDKFFEHVGFPAKTGGGDMIGCCPFCMEDSSWGKKKRFAYYSDKQALVCYNCGETHNAISFLKKIEGIDFKTLMQNLGEDDVSFYTSNKKHIYIEEPTPEIELPKNYININEKIQRDFFKDNYGFNRVFKEIKSRRLNTAINKGTLWFSPDDKLHKDRLIIPFYDQQDNLEFYQSRAMTEKQEKEYGKYISSLNGKKIFWGLNQIDTNSSYLFMLEGPLDAFFKKNAIASGGVKLNTEQKSLLEGLRFMYDIVICLDNDFGNEHICELYEQYITQGYKVFMWGGMFEDVKDFNKFCIDAGIDEITDEDILKHTYEGEEAAQKLSDKIELYKKTTPNNESCYDDYESMLDY